MPSVSLIIAYFASTSLILAVAGSVFIQGQVAGVLIGASVIALLRTGQFYYATETAPVLSLGNRRKAVLVGIVAAIVDCVVVAVSLVLIELIRSAALTQGWRRQGTNRAAIIAACIAGVIVVSPKLITRLSTTR